MKIYARIAFLFFKCFLSRTRYTARLPCISAKCARNAKFMKNSRLLIKKLAMLRGLMTQKKKKNTQRACLALLSCFTYIISYFAFFVTRRVLCVVYERCFVC